MEKLSEEAFKLKRTVKNFLSTHEPLLSCTVEQELNTSVKSSEDSFPSEAKSSKDDFGDMTLLSNSTTIKKNETASKYSSKSWKRLSTTTTEDESGFSSMNSFHEVGLPIAESHRESISSRGPADIKDKSTKNDDDDDDVDERLKTEETAFRVLWV